MINLPKDETNARVINVKGERSFKRVETLKDMQEIVGGYIEVVHRLRNPALKDCIMVVNEDGIPRNLPINHDASYAAGIPIRGDVFIMTREDWDELNKED